MGSSAVDWMICTTPRTGSHLLGRLLQERGWGEHGEWEEEREKARYRLALQASRNSGAPLGFLCHYAFIEQYGIPFENLTPGDRPVKYILLTRKDKQAQADSWAGARKSHRWFDGSTQGIATGGEEMVKDIRRMERLWRDTIKDHDYLSVTFETLTKNPEATADRVSKWLSK